MNKETVLRAMIKVTKQDQKGIHDKNGYLFPQYLWKILLITCVHPVDMLCKVTYYVQSAGSYYVQKLAYKTQRSPYYAQKLAYKTQRNVI